VENVLYIGDPQSVFIGLGNTLDNVIRGGAAGDTLIGYEGNDRLEGGSSAPNTLVGGLGNDTYVVSAFGDSIVELTGEGIDTVETTLSVFVLRAANVENLIYTSSGNFVGVGNELDNVITGGPGSDTLVGMAGNDTLIGGDGQPDTLQGGLGDDIFIVTATGTSVIEFANEGIDELRTTLTSVVLPTHVENLTYTGVLDFTGIGNGLDNIITGANGNDTLNGGLGNDTLIGGGGSQDRAIFSGNFAAYTAYNDNGVAHVNGPDGNDTAQFIEQLVFLDQTILAANLPSAPLSAASARSPWQALPGGDFDGNGTQDLVFAGPDGEQWITLLYADGSSHTQQRVDQTEIDLPPDLDTYPDTYDLSIWASDMPVDDDASNSPELLNYAPDEIQVPTDVGVSDETTDQFAEASAMDPLALHTLDWFHA
jgi:Ca2+-binding RTX toxin-like protein